MDVVAVRRMPAGFESVTHWRGRRALASYAPNDGTVHMFAIEQLDDGHRNRRVRGLHWRYRGLARALRGREYLVVTTAAPTTTLAHEIGHLLGLRHSTRTDNIMCSCRSGAVSFTDAQGAAMRDGARRLYARAAGCRRRPIAVAVTGVERLASRRHRRCCHGRATAALRWRETASQARGMPCAEPARSRNRGGSVNRSRGSSDKGLHASAHRLVIRWTDPCPEQLRRSKRRCRSDARFECGLGSQRSDVRRWRQLARRRGRHDVRGARELRRVGDRRRSRSGGHARGSGAVLHRSRHRPAPRQQRYLAGARRRRRRGDRDGVGQAPRVGWCRADCRSGWGRGAGVRSWARDPGRGSPHAHGYRARRVPDPRGRAPR
ncbi:MAG: matrixin family metalloprotease [Deltaproteobacteria bacterium]|nr:matrixin family metalloprotease [Deltaproteobacteria bacterium]